MRLNHKLTISLALLAFLVFGACFFFNPKPVDAYVPTVVEGETRWDPFRGPDMTFYVQSVVVVDSVTTDLVVSTACPDVDAYLACYDDMTLQASATAQFHCPLGEVETEAPVGMAAGTVTLVRTDPSVGDDYFVLITLIDYMYDNKRLIDRYEN